MVTVSKQPLKRVLIMAGGTGGHVYPALAVAQALRAQGTEVQWLGTATGIEANVVTQSGIPIIYVAVDGLRGKGLGRMFAAPFKLAFAVLRVMRFIRTFKPQVVLGMGGFVTGPGGVAAWLMRVPLVIHEQNAVLGLTNRLLAKLSACVCEAFSGAVAGTRKVLTGNPVREAILASEEPGIRLNNRTNGLHLLVLGGSQGAKAINEIVPEALHQFSSDERPQVWHQTGKRHLCATEDRYVALGLSARLEAFIDDMPSAYQWADLVICRAGALTVTELASSGVGSILIPFPYAVDDHQTKNGEYLVNHGAAILVDEADLTVTKLASLITMFTGNRPRLVEMARAAYSLAQPQATEKVIHQIREAAYG